MAVYAIGDIQGCNESLQKLLKKINFSKENDVLWFAGDLVNRGKHSLETLRFIKDLGSSAVCVLGNHDVSLLAMHYGLSKVSKTCQEILDAEDREVLIEWLRHRPVYHEDLTLGFCMAHAGISPVWDLEQAKVAARELEDELQGDNIKKWLSEVYGNKPRKWKKSLKGLARHRYMINTFMRMRFCHYKSGALNFSQKKPPNKFAFGQLLLVPWFLYSKRIKLPLKVVFGHWSSLGFYHDENVICLDTGCVWGESLTAVRLDDPDMPITSISCKHAK